MSQERIKLALVGYGKMGREIENLARTGYSEIFDVVSKIDPEVRDSGHKEINPESVAGADVCIDFTRPDVVVDNIKRLVDLEKQIVVGTTGWDKRREEVRDYINGASGGLVYARNFSFVVNAYLESIRETARKLSPFAYNYEVRIEETHHASKVDAPSGTARQMAEILKEYGFNIDPEDKEKVKSYRPEMKLGFIGKHNLIIGARTGEVITEMSNEVRSRAAYADGALVAARWIQGKSGFFTLDDMFDDMAGSTRQDKVGGTC